jgi:hypothetical protein
MKLLKKITNGIVLIIIGILHTQLVVSSGGYGRQFLIFSESFFFKISGGMDELPAAVGKTDFEAFAAFWFFYCGILLIPLGLLVHSIEKRNNILPHSFTISYLIFVLIGSYMVPNSGMTFFMLPQAIFMLASNYLKANKKHIADQ